MRNGATWNCLIFSTQSSSLSQIMTQTFQMMRVTRMQEMTIRLLLQVKCLIRERLRAVEAESGFLKHAAMTLQRGGEGTKLLTEIAQHLRELRHSDTATAAANA